MSSELSDKTKRNQYFHSTTIALDHHHNYTMSRYLSMELKGRIIVAYRADATASSIEGVRCKQTTVLNVIRNWE